MKKIVFLVSLFALLMQGCSQDDFVNEMFVPEEDVQQVGIDFPEEIETFGKTVAADIRTTIINMIEQGIDYSEIPDSIAFRERFFADWYAAHPKIIQSRSAQMEFPMEMDASEFAEKYQMLTDIQIDFIHKIIQECAQSSSDKDLLERLVVLRKEISKQVPEIEQDRLLNVISVLYYGVQTISELEAEGLMLKTPYNYNELQMAQVKTRAESGFTFVPEGCRTFLATVWTIAIGEPTPFGEIVAAVITYYVGAQLIYEVMTCKKREEIDNTNYCINKYNECIQQGGKDGQAHSGGWGYTKCANCLQFCQKQGYWNCSNP